MRCVVIGATGGIGRAVTEALVAAGAEVHALGRRPTELEQVAAETGSTAHAVDVLDADRLVEVFGGIGAVDVLVFAAGVGGVMAPFYDSDPAHIARIIGPNVTGLLNSVHAALPAMVERGRGHIVIIGSIAGLHPTSSPAYAASKGATHSFAQGLTLSLAGTGVRVTEICPGRVNTDCVPLANPDVDIRAMEPDSDALLQPEDIAAAVMYVVSTPPRVQVALIEVLPTRQVVGGSRFVDARPAPSPSARTQSARHQEEADR